MIMVRKKVLPLNNSVKSRGSGLNEGRGFSVSQCQNCKEHRLLLIINIYPVEKCCSDTSVQQLYFTVVFFFFTQMSLIKDVI